MADSAGGKAAARTERRRARVTEMAESRLNRVHVATARTEVAISWEAGRSFLSAFGTSMAVRT
jgi:hypothetical protein